MKAVLRFSEFFVPKICVSLADTAEKIQKQMVWLYSKSVPHIIRMYALIDYAQNTQKAHGRCIGAQQALEHLVLYGAVRHFHLPVIEFESPDLMDKMLSVLSHSNSGEYSFMGSRVVILEQGVPARGVLPAVTFTRFISFV